MKASGEIRLSTTTMRRMPVLAQSQDAGTAQSQSPASIPQASGPADYQIDTPITVTAQSTAPTSFNAWSAFLNGFTFSGPYPTNYNGPYNYGVFLPPLGGVSTVFKTAHYASRLQAVGIAVNAAEDFVANEIAALGDSLDVGASFSGRFTLDDILLEYRAMPLPNGAVSVGTIFPVQ